MHSEIALTGQEPLLLKVEEAARLLNIGRTRTYDLVRTGRLQSVKVFGSRRIPLVSLTTYVAALIREAEAA